MRWCRRSIPILWVDLLELFVNDFLNPHVLVVQVAQHSKGFHPRLGCVCLQCGQLFFNGLGHELAQGNASRGRLGLGFPEHRIGHLQRGLHDFNGPIFMGPRQTHTCHTTRPATTVATGPPRNVFPSKGELRLLEKDLLTSYVHARSVEKIVTSAGAPAPSVPRLIPRIRAGFAVNSSTRRGRPILPVCSSTSSATPSAVSRPRMPNGHCSNSCIFSLPGWGA